MYASPIPDLALKHILEGGLKLVKDEPVEAARRSSILRALVEIFNEASRGSAAMAGQPASLLVGLQEPPAFERFALFFRYLNRSIGNDLPARLSEAKDVLNALEQAGSLDDQAKSRAADLIQTMLAGIAREAKLSPLSSPRELRLSA